MSQGTNNRTADNQTVERAVPKTDCSNPIDFSQRNPLASLLLPQTPKRKTGFIARWCKQLHRIGWEFELLCVFFFSNVLSPSPLLFYKAKTERRKKKAPSILYAVYPTHFWIPWAHQNRIRPALHR